MSLQPIYNKKVYREYLKRKKLVDKQRESAGNTKIRYAALPEVINEYLDKGMKYDSLLAEYEILLSKYTDLLNSIK